MGTKRDTKAFAPSLSQRVYATCTLVCMHVVWTACVLSSCLLHNGSIDGLIGSCIV